MIASFRRLSKSIVGTVILVLFLLLILASFALQDISGVLGGTGFGNNPGTLAKVGGEQVTSAELDSTLQRRLNVVRQQNPGADYASLASEFDPILDSLIGSLSLRAFAADHDLSPSKRMIDAEIVKLPGARGLDGRFSQDAYNRFLQQERLSDAEVRRLIGDQILERLVLVPASASPRIPVGLARPYAAMQLELRDADIAQVPVQAFLGGIGNPTDAQIAAFYRANARRYMVPEQRVLSIVRVGPENVTGVVATDKEVADYYQANRATYAGKAQREISQVIVPAKATADQIAARLRAGTSFADAAKPAGFGPADIKIGAQTKEQFAGLTNPAVANAAFAANVGAGAVVGPLRSDLGWHVIRIDALKNDSGRSLAQVRGEIAERLTTEKRKAAVEDLVARMEEAIADGANAAEAAKAAGLTLLRTPPLFANGTAPSNPAYRLPGGLAKVLRGAFELDQGEDPAVETLEPGTSYALVGADQIIAAAPAPLAQIRDRVASDWRTAEARTRARAAASAIAAQVAKGSDLRAAIAASGVTLPTPQSLSLRRIQLAQFGGRVPPALQMVFNLAQGKSRMIAAPEGRGFVIVKVKRVVPGDVTMQPTLVTQIQREFEQTSAGEYAMQFARAIQADVGVKRNDSAVAEARRRILSGGN